jgi:hypothetical protein
LKELTHSELLFERYLNERGISYEREPKVVGKQKRPDYRVISKGRSFHFEVKEFGEGGTVISGKHDPLPSISEKIEAARKKFKEYKDDCCVAVFHACQSVIRSFHPPYVMSAAFGNEVDTGSTSGTVFPDKPLRIRFSGRGSLQQNLNTSISALVILQHFEIEERFVDVFAELRKRYDRGESIGPFDHAQLLETGTSWSDRILHKDSVRAVILENPYARVRFPSWILNGPLDQRWGKSRGSRWYKIKSMGFALRELRRQSNPVPYAML